MANFRHAGALLLCVPAAALFVAFFAWPVILILALSFAPPGQAVMGDAPTIENYVLIVTDPYYHQLFLRTYGIALVTTLACAALGLPEAYILHRMRRRWQQFFLIVILAPLLISVVVRTLGWVIILGRSGIVNTTLLAAGLTDRPITFLYTHTAIIIGLVHVLIPFMIIPVWTSLKRIDPAVPDAARSLGASERTVFLKVVVPMALPGVLSGSLVVFSLASSAFATPALMGGRRLKVMATAIYDEFLLMLNWSTGAAVAVILLVTSLGVLMIYNRAVEKRFERWN